MSSSQGLFGPDSVTWRVHAEPVTALGGLRALVMQALHPATIAVFDASSSFREDFWGRLTRTADYVGVVTYGTTADAERITARIRGVHRRVPGAVVPDAGDDIVRRATDADLLLWVHATLVDSFLTVTRRAGLRLSSGQADAYVEEQTVLARLIGVHGPGAPAVPASTADLTDYFRDIRPQLRATPAARAAVRVLLVPPVPGPALLALPAWSSLTGLGVATLPAWARRLYRLPGLAPTDLATSLALRALRTTLAAVPANLREGPHRTAARTRLAASHSAAAG